MNSVVFFTGRKIGAVCRGALGLGTPHGVRYDRQVDEDRVSCITFFHPGTDPDDAQWLKDHAAEIKALEQSLVLKKICNPDLTVGIIFLHQQDRTNF